MNRTGHLLRVLVLVSLLGLAGCAVTPATFSGSSASRSLTVWTYLAGDAEQANFDKLDALFAREHPDVDIRLIDIPLPEFGPKLLAAAGTGDGPDVILGNPVVDFPLLSRAKVYADLTSRWRGYPHRGRFADVGLWRNKAGRLYALHWRFNDLGVWYNKDILARYGISPPKTVAGFESAMRKIRQGGRYQPLLVPGDPSVQTAWASMLWLFNSGVNYCTLDSPKTVRVLNRMSGWVRKGYLPNDTAALPIEDAFDRFLAGDTAFVVGGGWEIAKLRDAEPGFRYGSMRVPAGPAGSKMSFAGESVGIGRYADNKDLAWDYLRTSFLSRPAQLTTFDQTGALPPRLDIRRGPQVSGSPLERPFVAALEPGNVQPWPDNPNTLDAQTEVGTTFSSLFSGGISGREAAGQMRSKVARAFEDGGGGC